MPALRPAATLTFDHFYLTLQAAVDGIGIAMGPTALVSDDLAAGRLVAPFAGPRLPSRSYCTYVPDAKCDADLVVLFRAWLEREGADLPRSSPSPGTPRSRRPPRSQ
jgi:LysR family glycine cleavage system transcriptional activator